MTAFPRLGGHELKPLIGRKVNHSVRPKDAKRESIALKERSGPFMNHEISRDGRRAGGRHGACADLCALLDYLHGDPKHGADSLGSEPRGKVECGRVGSEGCGVDEMALGLVVGGEVGGNGGSLHEDRNTEATVETADAVGGDDVSQG